MSITVWSPALSVGITEFDAEHRCLLSMFDDLFKTIGNDDGATQLGELIEQIFDCTNKHFANEEFYLIKYDYPSTCAT